MLDLGEKIQWTDEVEEFLKDLGEKSYGYSILHKKAEDVFNRKAVSIDIPSIILSTVAGTLSIGSSSMFSAGYEQYSQYFIGFLSISVGIIQTINSYFDWKKRSENHRLSHLQYGKLYRFISIELSLPREQRIRCNDLMKIIRENYERLQEISPLIPQSIIEEFKKTFKNYDVSKPSETNGLEPITIYREKPKNKNMMIDGDVIMNSNIFNDLDNTIQIRKETMIEIERENSNELNVI